MSLLLNANAQQIPLPDRSVDMVFTSPPFKDEDVVGHYWSNYDSWMEEVFRVADKVVIIINSVNRIEGVIEAYPADRYMVWGKGVSQCAYRWNPIFVYGLHGYKVNKYIWCDAFGVESITGKWKKHPYEDPVILYQTIIKMFDNCNSVLDPFCGSGTTGVACKNLNKIFIGCDIRHARAKMSKKRIGGFIPIADGINQLTIGV